MTNAPQADQSPQVIQPAANDIVSVDGGTPYAAPDQTSADAISGFAEFEAAAKAAAEAGEPGLFTAPPAVVKPEEKADQQAPAAEEKADKPPRLSAHERIQQLTRQKGDANRELAEVKARLAELEAARNEPSTDAGEADDDAPDPNDEKYKFGELDSAYVRDMAKHEARQVVREERAREGLIRQEQAARETAEAQEHLWADRLEAAAQKHPDFVEKVIEGAQAGLWPLNEEVGEMVKSSDVGPLIAYHLATNLNEAIALDKITDPVDRARAFGRLEARLESGAQPGSPVKPIKTPQADAPPQQVRGANGQFAGNTPTDYKTFEAKYKGLLT